MNLGVDRLGCNVDKCVCVVVSNCLSVVVLVLL